MEFPQKIYERLKGQSNQNNIRISGITLILDLKFIFTSNKLSNHSMNFLIEIQYLGMSLQWIIAFIQI